MIDALYTVIVNWNLKEDTTACIQSLVTAGASPAQIIVVDNGSTDGSAAFLRAHFGPLLNLIESERNLGFAAGNNLGIQYALDQGAEWVFLVNNDTEVAASCLTEFAAAIADQPTYAVLAPLILYYDDPDRIWYLGDHVLPGSLITINRYHNQLDQDRFPSLIPVDFLSGCGLLLRRDVLEEVGMFNPDFFMYGEDVELCWRIRQAGFWLACVTSAKMWHKVSVSSRRDRPAERYWRIRNQIRFYRLYAQGWQVPVMVLFTLIRALRLGLQDVIQGQPKLIQSLVKGYIRGWLNRPELVGEQYFYGNYSL
jgi:GT2 family glycosyltransferase